MRLGKVLINFYEYFKAFQCQTALELDIQLWHLNVTKTNSIFILYEHIVMYTCHSNVVY